MVSARSTRTNSTLLWRPSWSGIRFSTMLRLERGLLLQRLLTFPWWVNSKKLQWDTHMFAPNKQAATQVMLRLFDDGFLQGQTIICREYVPLKTFMTGPRGIPVTNEYRVFVLNDRLLCSGYYWAPYVADLEDLGVRLPSRMPRQAYYLVDNVIRTLRGRTPFYVVDVAETTSGEWLVVELNDGQMAGLAEIDPETFYDELLRECIYDM